jgi:hypothetical protein
MIFIEVTGNQMPKCWWKMMYESKDGKLKRGRVNVAILMLADLVSNTRLLCLHSYICYKEIDHTFLDNIQQVLLLELLPILLLLKLMFIGFNCFSCQ